MSEKTEEKFPLSFKLSSLDGKIKDLTLLICQKLRLLNCYSGSNLEGKTHLGVTEHGHTID